MQIKSAALLGAFSTVALGASKFPSFTKHTPQETEDYWL